MSVFSFVGCFANSHAPLRRDVSWDGRSFVGHCRHCGAPILRISHRNWRKDEPEPAEKATDER